ncbi:MAG: hypothetical protein ABEJ95_05165 [Candidatus Nanohalobium sp.]
MSKIESLRELGSDEHNEELFIQALNEALDEWRENDLYKQRLEESDAPEQLEDFEDVRKLPTVDMREFKDHPEELVANQDVEDQYALYSSGTTSDSKSYTLRSEKGYRRHKGNFQQFADYLMPEIDFMHVMSPSPKLTENMPDEQAQRSVFTYPIWIFEDLNKDFYLEKTEEGMEPNVDRMVKQIKQKEGNRGVFSTPDNLYKIAKKLDKKGIELDLGSEGIVLTAGGWKGESSSNKEEFRNLLEKVFGVERTNHLDFYGCTELFFATGNRYGDEDPDKKRIAPEGYIWVADEEKFLKEGKLERVEEGEEGLLIAVDPSNTDYPGVLLTDDIVRKTNGDYGEQVRIEYVGRSSL